MLADADVLLVRRDPLIPGLALVLDREALLDALEPHLGVEVRGATSRYARYKPRTSCLVAWELDLGATTLTVHAKAFASTSEKFETASTSQPFETSFGPGRLILPEIATVVSLFPHDQLLPGLARIDDRSVRLELLRDAPELQSAELRMLRYEPERRYVGTLGSQERPAAVLRIYPGHHYAAALRAIERVRSGEAYCVPSLIGVSRQARALAVEWMAGRPLADRLTEPDVPSAALAATAAALAELHGRSNHRLSVRTPAQEASDLLNVKSDMQFIAPDLSGRLEHAGRQLAARLAALTTRRALIHGDFHADQVIVGDVAQFIDLDHARLGDPASDTANFLAHLEARAVEGSLRRRAADRIAAAFLAACEAANRSHHGGERLALRTAASLFRLLPRPFWSRREMWRQSTEQMLERVEGLLARKLIGSTHSPAVHPAPIVVGSPEMPMISDATVPR